MANKKIDDMPEASSLSSAVLSGVQGAVNKKFPTTLLASAAQGALASTSLQPGDIGTTVQAYSAVLDGTTASFTTADETKLDGVETGAQVNTVDSVNSQTGAVSLDADDIDDTSTTNKFVAASDITNWNTAFGWGDHASGGYLDSSDKASASDIRAGTADKYITADGIESSAENVALSDGANVSIDWSAGINFTLTIAGNRTIDLPSNGEPGTTRTILITQDGTGSRTATWASGYVFAGGTSPTLTTTASAVDFFSVYCLSASSFLVLTVAQDIS